jgi:nitrate reductase assembly molybdenum cofactor insertion protein NarJ
MPALSQYERLADLFDYPDVDYPARSERARAALRGSYPEAAARLEAFAAALPQTTAELQEIFTRTFDVQAVTTLSVGYLLFGDDYKRGELLSHLRREQNAASVDTGVELPDHLPNVLRLIARWTDRELAAELVDEVVRPAVRRMLGEFGPERMARRDRLYEKHFRTLIASPAGRAMLFRDAIDALALVLDRDFEPRGHARAEPGGDFLQSLGVELDLEAGKRS